MSFFSEFLGHRPTDMLDDYKNIEVVIDGAKLSIAINAYRNNDNAKYAANKGGTQDAMSIKDALLQVKSSEILKRAGGAQNYYDVFSGKGSPDAIAAVLLCFHDYADGFIKAHKNGAPPRKKCAAWLADQDLSWKDTLQNISNEFLGLDCNGFVGNWMKRCQPSLKLGPQQGPKEFYNARQQTRTGVDKIEYWDVVVWANFSHIAVIDNPTTGPAKFNICQSAGGGPRVNEYTVVPSSPGKFRLYGGVPSGDVGGEVYVISHWN